jgi:hypothetical protein
MDWLQIVGLCVDMLGALVIAWPLVLMTDDEAVGIGLATLSERGERSDDLRSPTVSALIRQRTAAKVGVFFLIVGFLLQAVSRL